jgi:hypothetical protein
MDDVLVHLRGIDTELKKDGQCEGDCQECLAGDCAPIASAMMTPYLRHIQPSGRE